MLYRITYENDQDFVNNCQTLHQLATSHQTYPPIISTSSQSSFIDKKLETKSLQSPTTDNSNIGKPPLDGHLRDFFKSPT